MWTPKMLKGYCKFGHGYRFGLKRIYKKKKKKKKNKKSYNNCNRPCLYNVRDPRKGVAYGHNVNI